jgi:hypothetical protein
VVEALKIEAIVYGEPGGGATIHPVDTRYPPFKVSAEYVAKHGPRAGGYWVQYDGGLYHSFSPAPPFDEGYTLIVPPTKPTIAELEEILKEDSSLKININPDGTVTRLTFEEAKAALRSFTTAASQPMHPQGPAAQNLYPQEEGATADAATTVSDPDVHA